MLSKKSPVTIKTPVSTIGIRGGIAIVEIDPTSGQTKAIFVFGKEMTVTNLLGDTESTTVPGSIIEVKGGDIPPSPPVTIQGSELKKMLKKMESSKGEKGGSSQKIDSKKVYQIRNLTEEESSNNNNQT